MSDTHLNENTTTSTASPGELLSSQREQLGVPLTDAALALNLRPAVVEGLERDHYDEIPVVTYRRGYLRAYAKYLGMDERVVLEAYQARFGTADAERKVTPVTTSRPPSRAGAWLFKLVTLLVIAGLIGVTVMWWQSRGGSEPPSMGATPSSEEESQFATPENDAAADLPDTPVSSPAPSDAQNGADEESAEQAPVSEPEPVQPSEAAIASAQTIAATQAEGGEEQAQTDARTMALTFNEQSWTEIFDATNQRVFVGLQTPGTTATVEGEPPFRLTIGNATGVELIYLGESVDLGQRAGANNVARFTLGE